MEYCRSTDMGHWASLKGLGDGERRMGDRGQISETGNKGRKTRNRDVRLRTADGSHGTET